MRYTATMIVVAALVTTLGCNKQPNPAQVAELQPQVRPIEQLKPISPAKPEAVQAPTAQTQSPASEPSKEPQRLSDIGKNGPTRPRTYTIKKADTLWSIAVRFLGDGKRWKEIVDENPGLDPRKLKPGQTVRLPKE